MHYYFPQYEIRGTQYLPGLCFLWDGEPDGRKKKKKQQKKEAKK